jgi:hypothetical protein
MASLFRSEDAEALIARVLRLAPEQKPLWGRMNPVQMLAHSRAPLRVATGQQQLKRNLIGFLFGGLAKRSLLKPTPFGRNLPTDKSFLFFDANDFEKERDALIGEIRSFQAGGPAGLTPDPHPFFGRLTADEWDRLQWKHLDHHLRQFGV